MRFSIFAAVAASTLLVLQAGAIAQTNTPEHVRDVLRKQGFTDVQVVPQSYLIHAKDKDGNTVVMSVTPNSVHGSRIGWRTDFSFFRRYEGDTYELQ